MSSNGRRTTVRFTVMALSGVGYGRNLSVVRLPLEDMANDTDEPEINKRYHLHLVDWMMYRAYSKQDSETVDMAKANKYLATFEAQFGRESTANEENWINREHGYTQDEGVY